MSEEECNVNTDVNIGSNSTEYFELEMCKVEIEELSRQIREYIV